MKKAFKALGLFLLVVLFSAVGAAAARLMPAAIRRVALPLVQPLATATPGYRAPGTFSVPPEAAPSQVAMVLPPPLAIATSQAIIAMATQAQSQALTQVAQPTPTYNPVTATTQFTPASTATTIGEPPRIRLIITAPAVKGIASGTAPLRVEFSAALFDVMHRVECQSVSWEWGDGTSTPQSCASQVTPSEYPVYTATHIYANDGLYFPKLNVTLNNGTSLASNTGTVSVGYLVPMSVVSTTPLEIWLSVICGLLGTAIAILLLRACGGRWKRPGYVAVLLTLFGLVPPFSYVPNPAGVFWMVCGCYSYDPKLPLRNGFVVAGRPEAALEGRLGGLLGQTGLDPLDPVQPLIGYEFLSVSIPSPNVSVSGAYVNTRMTYADGSKREYRIPVFNAPDLLGAYRFFTNDYNTHVLNRLFTHHDEFADTPFPSANDPHLSEPQRLRVNSDAEQLNSLDPDNWVFGYSTPGELHTMAMSPRGDSVLLAQKAGTWEYTGGERSDLWLVGLDGSAPHWVADHVASYRWSPDGEYIIYSQSIKGAPIFEADRQGGDVRKLAEPGSLEGSPTGPPVAVTAEGVWYIDKQALNIVPYDGGPTQKLPRPKEAGGPFSAVYPSPDGKRIAYQCGTTRWVTCLQGRDGANWTQLQEYADDVAWSPDGSKLATAFPDSSSCAVFNKDGSMLIARNVTPGGSIEHLQWTSNGQSIFMQTEPFGGRRIVMYELATGRAFDLSRPRWDTWFTLSSDGKYLLLNTGRGGFWRSDLKR